MSNISNFSSYLLIYINQREPTADGLLFNSSYAICFTCYYSLQESLRTDENWMTHKMRTRGNVPRGQLRVEMNKTGNSLVLINSTSAFLGVYIMGVADTWVLTTYHPFTTKASKCTIIFNYLNHLMKCALLSSLSSLSKELSFEKISNILKVI